jgi:hypothetical protein
MANEAARVMFEIYRESGYARQYRAVYFTELDENNKEKEISRAMAGEHVYDSFLSERKLSAGKDAVAGIIERLNGGEALASDDIAAALAPFEA